MRNTMFAYTVSNRGQKPCVRSAKSKKLSTAVITVLLATNMLVNSEGRNSAKEKTVSLKFFQPKEKSFAIIVRTFAIAEKAIE